MFYFVGDANAPSPKRKCWECGHEHTPREASACAACATPFEDRRFLMSVRWESEHFAAYMAYVELGLSHPGVASPVDVFLQDGLLFSVVPYQGEGLLVDESAPLPNRRLLDLGQRVAGVLAFLHLNGVRLRWVTQANVLLGTDKSVRMFDLEVESVYTTPVDEGERGGELLSLGELLRRYCSVEAEALAQFMRSVENGAYANPASFGRAVEQRFDAFGGITYGPHLAGMTDVGLVRQLNEDNWGWRKLSNRARLFVVADGMGGHDAGEVASEMAVNTWCQVAREREPTCGDGADEIEELVSTSFQAANNAIKDAAEAKGTDMGTTLVGMLLLQDNTGFIANVGDSRAYLCRDGALHQVSRDHSLVARMVEKGKITAEEARTHPHSNILMRTVGTDRDVEVDVFRVELKTGDRVIMCSDGLWGEVEDRDIENLLNTYPDPRVTARELVRAAHLGGGKDNVTVMIVAIP